MFYLQMNTTLIEQKLKNFNTQQIKDYTEYWKTITPTTEASEIYKRWLYAICSVHMQVEGSVLMYKTIIRNFELWKNDMQVLKDLIKRTGHGLYNTKAKTIFDFTKLYIADPNLFLKQEDETWVQCRDRVVKLVDGLAEAKTSFALEMIYPESCEVVCNDCHQFNFYKTKKGNYKHYRKLETHFLDTAKKVGVPPAIARQILFDVNLGYTDSRYWTSIFEDEFKKIKLNLTI